MLRCATKGETPYTNLRRRVCIGLAETLVSELFCNWGNFQQTHAEFQSLQPKRDDWSY